MSYNEKMIRECAKPYTEAYRKKFGINPTCWFGFLKYVGQVSFAGGFDISGVELAKLLGLYEDEMEEKKVKIMLVQSGNGSENYRLRIPTPWIKELGLDFTRAVVMKFDGNQIVITKKEEM